MKEEAVEPIVEEFTLLLAIVWSVVAIAVATIALIYVWAKRCARWKDSPWWMTLGFAIGMAKIAEAIGAILIFGETTDLKEGLSLANDFFIWLRDFVGCSYGCQVNHRRAKRKISN